ncbi:MAG: hypothetical protein D3923_14100, partial [Candidatus Electrothrix sp. AR3]|nr:hypothetical protein [Candidatus Electrothrix sp. AR3]
MAVAQLNAVLIRLAGQIYAVPMHDIHSVIRAKTEQTSGHQYDFEGTLLPLIHPAAIPHFQTGPIIEPLSEAEQAVLIVHVGAKRAAILCDQLLGQRDVVFKNLGTLLT